MSAWVVDRRVGHGWHVEHRDGLDWYEAGRPFRDLPRFRRVLHKHEAQTRVWFADGDYMERCICGAYGLGAGRWVKHL